MNFKALPACWLALAFSLGAMAQEAAPASAKDKAASARHTYYTGGVHNDKRCKPASPQRCQ